MKERRTLAQASAAASDARGEEEVEEGGEVWEEDEETEVLLVDDRCVGAAGAECECEGSCPPPAAECAASPS